MSRADTLIARSSTNSISFYPNPGVLLPALLAMLVTQIFRFDQHRWIPAIWIESICFLLVPVLLFFFFRQRLANELKSRSTLYLFQSGAMLFGVLAITWQFASRSLGLGDSNEVLALLALQNVSWYLAVFSKIRGFEKACMTMCGAVVFFICCMTDQIQILIVCGIFALLCLWWLLGLYWDRLDSQAIDGSARMLPIHGTSVGIAALAMVSVMAAAAYSPFQFNPLKLTGFSPFSGGEDGYQNEFANSGIGDGHLLKAGKNAKSTGAVDSDEFIEDDKPSFYDVVTERYEGPVFKRRRNRSVSIDTLAKHMHDAKRAELSGQSFRTMRDNESESDLALQDKLTEALFFVEGTVPARFAVDTFQQFDGWDWTKATLVDKSPSFQPPIQLHTFGEKPIYSLSQYVPNYLPGRRHHRIKMMRLETDALTSPAFISQWHIALANNPDLFRWKDGLIRMNGGTIASDTVIDIESFIPNYHMMRADKELRFSFDSSELPFESERMINTSDDPEVLENEWLTSAGSVFLQVPDNATRQQLSQRVENWIDGVQPGWNQVEAITNRVRSEFKLNPGWEIDQEAEDTVGHFFEQGEGPSWMFATTCVMALRTAGYKTRLASGFLVRKDDYDRTSKQSVVDGENLHMWPEVCLDGRFWIPVEPTPGYPVPYSTQTVWEWLVSMIGIAINVVIQNPLTSILTAASTVFAFLFRADLVSLLALCWWYVVRFCWPRGLVRATRQLIDTRFWAAGHSRPHSETIRTWYTRVEPRLATGFFELWNLKNFCSGIVRSSTRPDLVNPCSELVNTLSLKRIRQFVSQARKQEKKND